MDSVLDFLSEVPWWAWVLFALFIVAIRDVFFNKRHAVSHNFPIVGHIRYMLESIAGTSAVYCGEQPRRTSF